VVLANWPWIEGYVLFSHYVDLGDFYSPEARQHFVSAGGLLSPLRVYVPSPKLFSLIPPVFALLGLWAWWRERRSRLLVVFLPQIVVLFVVAFYGGFFGLHALGPARFTLPLGLYLFFLAAHGLTVSAEYARRQIGRRAEPRLARAIGFAIVMGLALLVLGSGATKKFWRPYTLPGLQTSEGFTRHGMPLINWLRENTDSSGRLLHEETDRRSHQYYGSHMAALVPLYTGRELAGGPAPHALLKHNFLRFIAGTFRGRPISETDPDSLSHYLWLYNVRWVLCWSAASKAYFARLDMVDHVSDYDKFSLYRFTGSPSYFLKGTGQIVASRNRIELRDLIADQDSVIIKYHWLESLRADPPSTIEPVYVLDDPVPFISIADPPAHLVIYNDYGIGLSEHATW
jgi:hypothetical protein